VRAAIAGGALFPSRSRLVLGVSGGSDSMALLAVLDRLRDRPERADSLVVAHFDHRLRGAESARDAAFVADAARARGLRCVVGAAASPPPHGANVEAWAREGRYRFLDEVRREVGGDAVCVAHTRDDQAETVLLRLARGAGPAALAAMEPRRRDGVVRPLLARARAECRAYLRALGQAWVHDSSNDDTRRLRSRVRHTVLPVLSDGLGVDAAERLARLASELRVEARLAERYLSSLLPEEEPGELAIAAVDAAGDGASRLVHAWLARAGIRATSRQVAVLVAIAHGLRPSATVDLAGGVVVGRRYGALAIESAPPRDAVSGWRAEVALPGTTVLPNGWRLEATRTDAGSAVHGRERSAVTGRSGGDASASAIADRLALRVAADAVILPLCARPRRAGDRIRLAAGHRKLSDVLVDARVPRRERRHLVIVSGADDMVVWVPGVIASPFVAGPSSAPAFALRATPPERIGIAAPDRPW
jgi:tRNA(Ile)-lysidine synthase